MKRYVSAPVVIWFTLFLCILICGSESNAGYYDQGNGVVLDTNYSILWQQTDDGIVRNYYEAIEYCEDLDIGGVDDWALPSKTALSTLIDLNFYPVIDPVFIARNSLYLTSDLRSAICMPSGYGGGASGYSYSYGINFGEGSVLNQPIVSVCGMNALAGYVRCKSDYVSPKPVLSPITNLLLNSGSN